MSIIQTTLIIQIYQKNPWIVLNDQTRTTDVPDEIKSFLVVIEDKEFFYHYGINFKGIARAIYRNVMARKIVQGGSSITQQLARNLLNDNRMTYSRKIKELFKAIKLEWRFSKWEILDLYFNHVYFGRGLRGIKSASAFYFSKEVKHLSQIECIILLTILRSPNHYLDHVDQLRKRFSLLNQQLLTNKMITDQQFHSNSKVKIYIHHNLLSTLQNTTICYVS